MTNVLCGAFEEHPEHDDCPGGVKCQYCPNLLRRDLVLIHLQQVHADKLEPYREAVSEAVRKLSEETGVPLALVHSERASGGAPATHTGRPAQHSGTDFVTLGEPGRGKTLMNPALSAHADLLRPVMHVQDSTVFSMPLGAPKCPKGGCELTHPHLHTAAEMAEGDPLDNYCEHPNGFGVNGCPCGAVAPDDDAPRMFRNLDTGKDEYAIRCPATLDHAYDVYPESQMLRHLRHEHNWPQDKIDDWAESVGVATQSLIPDPLVEDMAQRIERQAEVDAFLNPQITVEDLMHAPDKPEDFHAWWVAMADREAPTVQRKAEEYGTNSLVEMGRIWARAQGRDVTDLEAVEIGCFLYAYGKIQRVADALLKGKSPNVDSWHDLTIYSLMVQFSREKGTWP